MLAADKSQLRARTCPCARNDAVVEEDASTHLCKRRIAQRIDSSQKIPWSPEPFTIILYASFHAIRIKSTGNSNSDSSNLRPYIWWKIDSTNSTISSIFRRLDAQQN
jgi:hypothetical protein